MGATGATGVGAPRLHPCLFVGAPDSKAEVHAETFPITDATGDAQAASEAMRRVGIERRVGMLFTPEVEHFHALRELPRLL